MPELPEMQALSERLDAALSDRALSRTDLLGFSSLKTFAPTPERALQVSFSSVYSDVAQVIVAPAQRAIKTVADTSGLKVAVVRGNTQDVAFTPIAPPGCTILRFDDDAGANQALLSGQVDALVTGSAGLFNAGV